MTLDPRPPLVEHRALRDNDAEWVRLARLTEADDRERARSEATERDLVESDEAAWAVWHHPTHGIFALQRRMREPVWYEDRPGYDRRCFDVEKDRGET